MHQTVLGQTPGLRYGTCAEACVFRGQPPKDPVRSRTFGHEAGCQAHRLFTHSTVTFDSLSLVSGGATKFFTLELTAKISLRL